MKKIELLPLWKDYRLKTKPILILKDFMLLKIIKKNLQNI